MSNYIQDPNTSILIPQPGVDGGIQTAPEGYDYATLISNALTTLSALQHTGAPTDGKQIPSAGINIDADLSANSNNLTNIKALRFTNNNGTLISSSDVNEFYVVNGNVYYSNANGTPVQITSGSSLNVQSGGANLSYSTVDIGGNFAILPSQTYSYFNVIQTPTIITLPAVASVTPGTFYIIKDATGYATSSPIIINTLDGSGDVIDDASYYEISVNYGCVILIAADNWNVERVDAVSINGTAITNTAAANTVLLGLSATNAQWNSITDDYIDGNAAIAGTKIDPSFGNQNISTSGSLTIGSIKDTGLAVGIIHSDSAGNFTSSAVSTSDINFAALPPNGAASGDLSSSYPGPTVSKLLGQSIPAITAGSLQFDGHNSLCWVKNNPTPGQIAQLKWYGARSLPSIVSNTGNGPTGICFDGSNIWVANNLAATVSKIDIKTGATLATVSVGNGPCKPCYDGYNIWVANTSWGTVTKINAATGVVIGSVAVGVSPSDICYDGSSVWTCNYLEHSVTKISTADGSPTIIGTYDTGIGAGPTSICSDGYSIWVGSSAEYTLAQLNGATGALISQSAYGPFSSICFDGTYIWGACNNDTRIFRILASTNEIVDFIDIMGASFQSVCYDGNSIWITDNVSALIYQVNAISNRFIKSYPAVASTYGICFDGVDIWASMQAPTNMIQRF